MLAACLTTVLFSLSAIFANRSIRSIGRMRANIGRLVVAMVFLGIYAHCWGGVGRAAGVEWFFLSGILGMGLGDLAVFLALPKLGSRLTMLMVQCLAVPIAGFSEWLWLGTPIGLWQGVAAGGIIAGVTVALLPTPGQPPKVRVQPLGFFWGILGAMGQAWGAVLSRRGYEAAVLEGVEVDGITAAYIRIWGGLAITLIWFAFILLKNRGRDPDPPAHPPQWLDYRWMLMNALAGATVGVACYQWALATTPSGIVLPIVATTPLVIVPLAYWLEGERPS